MLRFNVHGKHQAPTDPKLVAQADDEVLNAAETVADSGQANPQRELILYMRTINTPEVRQRLISMAHSQSAAADLANTALMFDHAPEANGPLLLEVKEQTDVPHVFKTATSWGVSITDLTDNPVSIERRIAIERKTPKGWKREMGIKTVPSCKDHSYTEKSPVHIPAHSSLAVYPWGWFPVRRAMRGGLHAECFRRTRNIPLCDCPASRQ